ncbi:MAG TPA: DUF4133 domain-containing protein [Segetibacter sp.]|jgi:hypothetical protein
MSNSIYQINKGINKSIEFKGLKAQYIWYFAGGVIASLILFAIMYIIGINPFICIGTVLVAGTAMTITIYAMSNEYGEYGMMKKLAKRSIPKLIRSKNRKVFMPKKQ